MEVVIRVVQWSKTEGRTWSALASGAVVKASRGVIPDGHGCVTGEYRQNNCTGSLGVHTAAQRRRLHMHTFTRPAKRLLQAHLLVVQHLCIYNYLSP